MKNTPYAITITAPLLRLGMTITQGPASEKYVVQETIKLIKIVREINEDLAEKSQTK